jgi:drug/metabolite transporter (DMT)-like permease
LSESGKGYTFAVLSALLSGINYVLGKAVLADMSPTHLVALIFSIAAVIQGAWMFRSGQWRSIGQCSRQGWLAILGFSAISIVALLTLWTGIKYLDPTVASFIARLQTLVTVSLGIYLLHERFRLIEAVGGGAVIGGLLVIGFSPDVKLSFWFWVMVASAISWGITEVSAKIALRYMPATPLSFVRTAIVAAFFLIWTAGDGTPLFNLGKLWWGVAAIAIMGPTLARWFYLFALQRLDVSKAALINQVQPLFVWLVAFAFMAMIPSLREWIGGLLILTGCAVMIAGEKRIREMWAKVG